MWTYMLTELNGTELMEVTDTTNRHLSLGLNRTCTASFSMRPDNQAMFPVFGGDTLLKVYQDKILRFHGDVVSTELSVSGNDQSIQVNCASPAFRLARRLLGLSKGGTAYTGDKAKTARKMISELNTDTVTYPINPETGILLNSEGSYSAGSGNYTAGPYRPALACINDLAHTLSGFDWYIAPIEYASGKIGLWEAKQAYGNVNNLAFELGAGQRNVKGMNYVRDKSDLVNKAFHLPGDIEKEAVLNELSEPSIAYRGRYEAVADAFGINDTALREAWLDEVIRVKSSPRYVVSMTLATDTGDGSVPRLGTDFWLGDTINARAVLQGTQLFSGRVRVYGVEVDINEAGTPSIIPVLLDEEGNEL